MKSKSGIFLSLAFLALLFSAYTHAGDSEKMVIQLKTDDFEVAETDISDLAVGEAETIVTENGKVIDLLRTADGVEIYVDGELLEMPHSASHEGHHDSGGSMHKSIVIECEVDGDTEGECDEHNVWISEGEDLEFGELHEAHESHKVMRIHKSHDGDSEVNPEAEKIIIIEKD